MVRRLPMILLPALALAATASAAPLGARFELAREVPWSADGLKETVSSAGGGMLLTDKPKAKNREVPAVAMGPDGRIWLYTKNQLGVATDGGFQAVGLGPFGAVLHDVAPLADGAVVLGGKGRQNVLARLGADGAAAWRATGALDPSKADLPTLTGVLRRLSVDADGAVYLYATRQAGQIGRVAPADGAITPAVTIDGFKSPAAWVVGGVVYRADGPESGPQAWVARPVAGGADGRVEPEGTLARSLGAAVPLHDGGAMLTPLSGLVRMGADGKAAGELPLAGVVRGSDGALYVALSGGGGLDVTRWADGKPGAKTTLGGLSGNAQLVGAGPDGFAVAVGRSMVEPGTLAKFDASGAKTGEEPLGGKSDMFLGLAGGVDLGRMIAGKKGELLLPGADARGAYVVRVTLP